MTGLFRTNHPAVYGYLLIYTFLLKGIYFLFPYEPVHYTNAIFGKLLIDFTRQADISYNALLVFAILLVYGQAILVNYLLTSFGFVKRQTTVPAMIFITLSSLVPEFVVFSPVLIANFFVLLSFDQLFKLPDARHTTENLFYTAVLISVATLFYWPVTAFIVILLVSTLWFKTAHWRDFAVTLIGFLLPYYFTWVYFYLIDDMHLFTALLAGTLPSELTAPLLSTSHLVMIAYLGFLYLIGYWQIQQGTQNQTFNIRRYYQLLQLTMTLLLVTYFLISGNRMFYIFFLLFPITIYLVPLFEKPKISIYNHLMYWGLIGIIAYFQLRHVFWLG